MSCKHQWVTTKSELTEKAFCNLQNPKAPVRMVRDLYTDQECALCPATCQRDGAGHIIEFSAIEVRR